METVWFDWSIRRGVLMLNSAGEYTSFHKLIDMVKSFIVPTRIVGEATFESFNLDERQVIIQYCQDQGHELLTVPNRLTGKWRKRLGFETKKPNIEGDKEDVQAIKAMSFQVHLKRPALDSIDHSNRVAANAELMRLRSNGRLVPKPVKTEDVKFVSEKDDYADRLIALLPDFSTLSSVRQSALGNGKGYSKVTVAAVGVCAKYASSTREFDSLSGMYAHGYPSQIRADLMHWGWAGGNTRGKLDITYARNATRLDGLTLSEYRRELRWLFRQLKNIPEM